MGSLRKKVISATLFAVAMGFLEAVVVVYLRQIYYPGGFSFPLRPMSPEAVGLEMLREISTIVMLVAAAALAGRTFSERFSFFLLTFGIWDLCYYLSLKALLNWPSSLMEWDILFLIPVAWVGPVLAPVISAFTMILFAVCILRCLDKGHEVRIGAHEWWLLLSGAFIIFLTFIWDFASIIVEGAFLPRFWSLGSDPEFQRVISHFVPTSYHWWLFAAGEVLVLLTVYRVCRRTCGGTDKE